MTDKLFNTEEKRERAINAFSALLQTEGWKLLEQMLDQDIENLRNDLETIKDESETKEQIDLQRYKLSFCKEHRNKPKDMIQKLQRNEQEEPNPDPFPTVESEAKKRT